MPEPQMGDIGELWATGTTYTLHATAECCGNRGYRSLPRTQVKDHAKPDYFDLDSFSLCAAAQRLPGAEESDSPPQTSEKTPRDHDLTQGRQYFTALTQCPGYEEWLAAVQGSEEEEGEGR